VVAATVAALPIDDDRIITIIIVTNKKTRATPTSTRLTGIARAFAVYRFFVAGCDCSTQLYLLLLFEREEDGRPEGERVRKYKIEKKRERASGRDAANKNLK